ncbi:MAG: hemolysin family protein [Victivallaceae bacterium]|jgi:CBS domain containing-hemolysin-like protein
MIVFIVSVMTALCISFLCSVLEAALLSLTPIQIAGISQRRPSIGTICKSFKDDIEKPIAVILVLNTAAHTIGAAFAGSAFDDLSGGRWMWIFSLVFTILMIQYAEILPKTLGVRFNSEVAVIVARPLLFTVWLMMPVIKLIHVLNRPFESRKDRFAPGTLEEISLLAGLARLSHQISSRQERIITKVSRLSQQKLAQIMVPLENISFISTAQTIGEALITAHIDLHTRFPVCENGDKNQIAGYINFKELIAFMRLNPANPSLRGIIRPIQFASPLDSAADLMEIFSEQHIHMAVVRDESGHTLGLVTLEDIVEELVGELEDEFDRLPRMLYAQDAESWVCGGGVLLKDLAKEAKLSLPESSETISSWLLSSMNAVPKSGDACRRDGMVFNIRRVRRGKPYEIYITRQK